MPKPQIIVLFDVSDTLFDTGTETPMPGALELVAALRRERVNLGIVSGMDDDYITRLLVRYNILDAFPVVVGFKQSQLDIRRYEIAIEQFDKILPGKDVLQEIFVVDDRMSRMNAAAAMGLRFLAVATGGTSSSGFLTGSTKPYRIFEDLRDTEAIMSVITGRSAARQKRKKLKA